MRKAGSIKHLFSIHAWKKKIRGTLSVSSMWAQENELIQTQVSRESIWEETICELSVKTEQEPSEGQPVGEVVRGREEQG